MSEHHSGDGALLVACEPTNCCWKGGGGSRLEERENWRKVKMPKDTKTKFQMQKKGSRLVGGKGENAKISKKYFDIYINKIPNIKE